MRFRRGSSAIRDCATTERGSAAVGVRGNASLPPYRVRCWSTVRRYASYCRGKFFPQIEGSSVSSVNSTTRKNGLRASCLRSKMLTSSAVRAAGATAAKTPGKTKLRFMVLDLNPWPTSAPAPGVQPSCDIGYTRCRRRRHAWQARRSPERSLHGTSGRRFR
jgi:hypothetical protein